MSALIYFAVVSADGLEGLFQVRSAAEGYLFELRGLGVPGLRIDEMASAQAALANRRYDDDDDEGGTL